MNERLQRNIDIARSTATTGEKATGLVFYTACVILLLVAVIFGVKGFIG